MLGVACHTCRPAGFSASGSRGSRWSRRGRGPGRCRWVVIDGAMSAPTSLVSREQIAAKRWVLRRAPDPFDGRHCARFPMDYLDLESGALRPGSCKSMRCGHCGEFEVKRRVWKAAQARPTKFLTLTRLPEHYQTARESERRFLRIVRRAGYPIEWLIAHELTKSGLRHAHALVKAPYIPQGVLSEAAYRSGMGYVVDIRAIRGAREASGYALKEALRVMAYATKGSRALEEHLALNGGRLYRTTRGYWST
jgi:hypothetical protein